MFFPRVFLTMTQISSRNTAKLLGMYMRMVGMRTQRLFLVCLPTDPSPCPSLPDRLSLKNLCFFPCRYFAGTTPVLIVADIDMLRQILVKRFDCFQNRNVSWLECVPWNVHRSWNNWPIRQIKSRFVSYSDIFWLSLNIPRNDAIYFI